jgi:hypothetical protein
MEAAMSGILYIDRAEVEATTGHMLVTFMSGGEAFRFHLPRSVALRFRDSIMRDAWQVCCVPNDPIPFKPKRRKR